MEYTIRIETLLISAGRIIIKYKGLALDLGTQWKKLK
jgi:hypothetical protein